METYKVIIAGGRDFVDYNLLREKVNNILTEKRATHKIVIVSGCARGADTLGMRYASENIFDVDEYPADWDKYGKKAGYMRNVEMAENADALIAFWDGKSKGTKSLIKYAKNDKKEIIIISDITVTQTANI